MARADWQNKYNDEFLNRMRYQCDPLADAVVALMERKRPSAMLEEVEARARSEGGPFQAFLDTTGRVPDWVDWERIERARRTNLAFSTVRGLALLVSSLVEGYSLSKAAHVLVATGRLHQDVTRRVYETAQMSHNMNVRNGMHPGQPGHRIVLEVRLLHAMVRKYLRQRGWDTSLYDEPINQEDMAFTIIEFNYLAIRGMDRLGAVLSEEDRADAHHYWRYAAWLHGVDEQLLTDSLEEEIFLYERIRAHQYNPNEESRMLAMTVLKSLAGKPPFYFREELLFEMARTCLGDALADAYELPRHAGWRKAVDAWGVLNKAATYAHYHVPGFARLSETLNFSNMRRTLIENLEPEERRRAFKQIA